jgi:phytol kinase
MSLLFALLACVIIFIILCSAEIQAHRGKLKGEFARKYIHITVGTLVAFWPFIMDWGYIIALSGAFLVVVAISKKFRIFKAAHSVKRATWGEAFFAISVGLLAILTDQPWIYAIALLHMSLADGLAAVIGTKFGANNSYKVVGHTKSVAGTMAFIAVSAALFGLYGLATGVQLSLLVVASGVFIAAAFENFSAYGLDNLIVPVWVAFALSML